MPTGKTLSYCWDSCTFISALTQQGRTTDELENLAAVCQLVDEGGCSILTPSITVIEVLACKMTDEQERSFQDLLQRSNVVVASVTPRIAGVAREIRNAYAANGLDIPVPDSIHLATAIHYKATALHTYDGGGKRPRRTDLLSLTTPVLNKFPIVICKPAPPPAASPEAPLGPTTGNLFNEEEPDT